MGKQEENRKQQINLLKEMIGSKFYTAAEKNKLLACYCLEYGCSRRTALEYFMILLNSGMIQISEEKGIWLS